METTLKVLVWILTYGIGSLVAVLVIGYYAAYWYGRLRPQKVLAKEQEKLAKLHHYPAVGQSTTAILVACYKGEGTIGTTVSKALLTGCPVYVVIDGPGDNSGEVARAAGAQVLELPVNAGKPTALWKAYQHFELSTRYKTVAILDDDVMIEPDFVEVALQKFTPETAIVVGKNITWWPKQRRWNIWLATRAFSYWQYQVITRRIQSWFNVMNCISGSNSVYRVELLDIVLGQKVRYIVDDTWWVLETHRKGLGKIVYAPKARAHLQDPTNFRDWRKQNIRWLQGTFQGIFGHRVLRERTWFDAAYGVLILNWVLYILGMPLTAVLIWWAIANGHAEWIAYMFVGYWVFGAIASIALKRFELFLLIPAIIAVDFIYRWIFVESFIKAIRQPTVDSCRWESPTRMTINNAKEVNS